MRRLKREIQQDTIFDDVVLFRLQYVNLDNSRYKYLIFYFSLRYMITIELNLNYDYIMDRRCRVIELPLFIIPLKTWIIIRYLPTLAVKDAHLLNAHIMSCTSRGNFHSTYVPRVSFWCCFLFVKATTGKSMEMYVERFFIWGRKFFNSLKAH